MSGTQTFLSALCRPKIGHNSFIEEVFTFSCFLFKAPLTGHGIEAITAQPYMAHSDG